MLYITSVFPECTRLLLAAGANVNAVDSDGNSVLHYAARTEQFSYLQVKLLHDPTSWLFVIGYYFPYSGLFSF